MVSFDRVLNLHRNFYQLVFFTRSKSVESGRFNRSRRTSTLCFCRYQTFVEVESILILESRFTLKIYLLVKF